MRVCLAEIAKSPQFLHIEHANPRGGSRAHVNNRKSPHFLRANPRRGARAQVRNGKKSPVFSHRLCFCASVCWPLSLLITCCAAKAGAGACPKSFQRMRGQADLMCCPRTNLDYRACQNSQLRVSPRRADPALQKMYHAQLR